MEFFRTVYAYMLLYFVSFIRKCRRIYDIRKLGRKVYEKKLLEQKLKDAVVFYKGKHIEVNIHGLLGLRNFLNKEIPNIKYYLSEYLTLKAEVNNELLKYEKMFEDA